MTIVNVARDFTKYPAGRKKSAGPTSGEEFRERFLLPYITNLTKVVIELDGVIGYGSSFLEEAFGGAVRTTGISREQFDALVELRSADQALLTEIREYVSEAARRKNK